ncbi:MAG: UbiA family prenyltransferase [Candidatus Moranbacteria bacterium]|nr:UbiA family prenyltransferase [Candidatus Moranbacteria bacterium]
MKRFFFHTLHMIENTPLTLASFAMTFFALIVARLLIENALGLFQPQSFFYLFFEFAHTFLFFLCSFILLLPLVRFAGNTDYEKAAHVLLFGFLIILTPPIIDVWIFNGAHFWSFYEFDGLLGLVQRYFTFFGDTPNMGITYGVRVEVALVTIALGFYAFLTSRRITKAILVSLFAYSILFVLGTFPSWITILFFLFQKSLLAINANDVAALFLTPENIFSRHIVDFRSVLNVKMSLVYALLLVILSGIFLFREHRVYSVALWRNARFPQLLYHGGLLLLGMFLALHFTDSVFPLDLFHGLALIVLLCAVESAWLASVIANDFYDIPIDEKTNKDRPLIQKTIPQKTYALFGCLFFFLSLFFAGIVNFSATLLLLAYQTLAWLYSAPPLRLKRFPLIATLFAATAGLLILIIGFLVVSPTNNLSLLPLPILLFLFLAYLFILPVKDFKDSLSDGAHHVYTIPVLLGIKKAKLLLGSFVFLFYVASIFLLNMRALLPIALCVGSLSFWIIQKGVANEKSFFSFRALPGQLLALTIIYGLVIAYSLS